MKFSHHDICWVTMHYWYFMVNEALCFASPKWALFKDRRHTNQYCSTPECMGSHKQSNNSIHVYRRNLATMCPVYCLSIHNCCILNVMSFMLVMTKQLTLVFINEITTKLKQEMTLMSWVVKIQMHDMSLAFRPHKSMKGSISPDICCHPLMWYLCQLCVHCIDMYWRVWSL